MRALRRWRTGLAIATACFAVGTVRLLVTGSTGWLTSTWFVLAAVYAFVGLVARRLVVTERAQDWLGRLERRPRFATLLRADRAAAGMTGHFGPDSNREQRIRYLLHGGDEAAARDRIANALVTVAAVVGMVLVVTGAGHDGGADGGGSPGTTPTTIRTGAPVHAPTGTDDHGDG